MAWTFSMVCVAWVFFRAESVGEALSYLKSFGSNLTFHQFTSEINSVEAGFLVLRGKYLFTLICITLIAENFFDQITSIIFKIKIVHQLVVYFITLISVWLIIEFALRNNVVDFIYFQF